jgi:hypothetical protein
VATTDIIVVLKDKASPGIKRLGAGLKQLGDGVSGGDGGLRGLNTSLGSLSIGAVAGAGAIGALSAKMIEFTGASIEAFASAERLGFATDGLSKRINETGESLTKSIIDASGGTVDALTAMEAANKALSFGIINSREDMEVLVKTAKVLGPALGQSVAKALDDVTIGLGRNSKLILDNLGIIVDAKEAQEAYAEKLGVTTKALTDEQKTLAFREEALRKMLLLTEQIGEQEEGLANKTERASAAFTNLKIAVGDLINLPAGAFLDNAEESISRITTGVQAWIDITRGLGPALARSSGILRETSKEIDKTTESVKQNIGVVNALQDMTVASWVSLIKLVSGHKLLIEETNEELRNRIKIESNIGKAQEEAIKKVLVGQRKEKQEAIKVNRELLRTNDRLDFGKQRVDALNLALSAVPGSAAALRLSLKESIPEMETLAETAERFMDVLLGAGVQDPLALFFDKTRATLAAKEEGKEAGEAFQKGLEEQLEETQARMEEQLEEQFREVGGITSRVLGEAFGVLGDLGLEFLNEDTGRAVAEDARRLAAIAAGDFSGEAAKLLEQSNPELFRKVMEAEDPAVVAQGILQKFNRGIDEFGLIDREAAKQRIKNLFLGGQAQDQLIQELTSEVAQDLGVNVAQVQAAIRGEFGGATTVIGEEIPGEREILQAQKIQQEIEGIGRSGFEAGADLKEGFETPVEPIDFLNFKLEESLKILDSITAASATATENITGMGSALGLPTTATAPGPQMANGGSFVVPPQFTNDSMSINVNAGELVNVQTPSQMSSGQTINLVVDGQVLASVVSQHQGQQLAQSQVQGNNVPFI